MLYNLIKYCTRQARFCWHTKAKNKFDKIENSLLQNQKYDQENQKYNWKL